MTRQSALAILFLGATASAAVTPDPAPASARRAADYRVFVNGLEAFVHDTDAAAFVSLTADGPFDVEVRPRHDVRYAVLRPLHLGIQPRREGDVLRFRLPGRCQASLELNNEVTRPLYFFVDAPPPPLPGPGRSGVRFFEAGRIHEAGRIVLRSHETLVIPAGAIVRGYIHAEDAEDVKILGRGILVVDLGEAPARGITLRRCRDVLVEGLTIVDSPTWTIVPLECDRVTIRDVKVLNWRNGSDGIDLVGSSDVLVERSFVRANDDCIAVKTFGLTEDPWSRMQPGRDVRNITVRESVFWNMAWGNALEIGFELRAGSVSDVAFLDSDVIHVERGATFSIHNGDTATVHGIRFEDIRVEDARHKLVDLAVFYSQYSLDKPQTRAEVDQRYMDGAWDGVLRVAPEERAAHTPFRGRIADVVFRNVEVLDGPFPFSILSGWDEAHAVENVTFENLVILGQPVRSAEEGRFAVNDTKGLRFQVRR